MIKQTVMVIFVEEIILICYNLIMQKRFKYLTHFFLEFYFNLLLQIKAFICVLSFLCMYDTYEEISSFFLLCAVILYQLYNFIYLPVRYFYF